MLFIAIAVIILFTDIKYLLLSPFYYLLKGRSSKEKQDEI